MGEGGVRLLELVALERVVGGVPLDRVDVEAHLCTCRGRVEREREVEKEVEEVVAGSGRAR